MALAPQWTLMLLLAVAVLDQGVLTPVWDISEPGVISLMTGMRSCRPRLSRSRKECVLVFIPVPQASVYLGGESAHVCSWWKCR